MLLKCCSQYISKFGKLSSGHRTGKGQFSFQSPGWAMPKNVQATIRLHLFLMLVRLCSKSFKQGFNSTWTRNWDVQARFIKGRGTREQTANIWWIIQKAKEFQENICFIDYTNTFDCVDQFKLLKILKEIGMPDHFTCLLRNLYSGEEQQSVPDMEQWTGSKLERSMTRLYIVTLLI